MSKLKRLNAGLILSSMIGCMEWGDQSEFLFQSEGQIIVKLFKDPISVIHPLVLLPLIGQVVLFINILRKKPNKWISISGNSMLSILLYFLFIIGLMSLNYRMILFNLPFVFISVLTFRRDLFKSKKRRKKKIALS